MRRVTRLMHALEGGRVRTVPDIARLTHETGEEIRNLYGENLSSSMPGTAEAPLPVGVRSGELRQSAEMVQVNQFRVNERNDAEHAGWIEHDTAKLALRCPLSNAVEQVDAELPGEMGEVLRDVWRE